MPGTKLFAHRAGRSVDFGPGGVVGFEPDEQGEANRRGVGRGAGKRLGLRSGGPFGTMRFGKHQDTGVIMVSSSPNAHRRAVSEGHGVGKNNTLPQESESNNAVKKTSTPTTTLTAGGPTPRTTKEYTFEGDSRDNNNCKDTYNDQEDDENHDDSMMEPIRPTRAAVNIAIPSPSATPAPIPKADISIGGVSSGGEESYNGLALTSSDDTAPMAERTVSGGSGPSDGAPSLRARRAARWHGGQPFAGGPPSESSLSTSPHMSLKPTTSASSAGGGAGAGASSRRSPVLGQESQFRGPSIGTTLAATNTNVSTHTTNTTKSPTLGSTNSSFGAQSASINGTSGVAAGLLSHLKAPAAAILPLSKGAAMKDVQVNARFYGDADVRAKLRLLASDVDFDDIVDHGFPQIRLSGGSHGSHGDAASDDGARSFEFRDHSSAGSLAGLSDDYGSSGASAISYVTVPGARRDMTLKMTLTPSTMRADEETLYGWQKEQFDNHAPPTPTTPTSLAASDLRDSDDNIPPIPPMPDNISVGPGRESHDAPSVHGNEGVSEFIPVGGLGGNNSSRRIKNVFGGLRKKNQRQPPANAYMITSSSAN